MEGRTKVTKEVLCEESRFILANVMAEARYGQKNRFDDIQRVCEGAVSIPFSEYVNFLEAAGYLKHDTGSQLLEVTEQGEKIVNGGNLKELTSRAVEHFKNQRAKRRSVSPSSPPPVMGTNVSPEPAESVERGMRAQSVEGEIVKNAAGGTTEDSRYEKLASIGSGGIGHVYRARQIALHREVALKELREVFGMVSESQRHEICRRFTKVVRASAFLAHPNILPIHDCSMERDYPFVVTELAPNGSVRRLITEAESIPVSSALKYLLQTLHALRAAHSAGIMHRGLKPENLLVDAYGNIKVSDFGFARVLERDQQMRQMYVGVNGVAYMAPELFQDPTKAGPQSDIYALGIIFYELLTRTLPGRRSPMPSQIDPSLPQGIDDIFDNMTRDSRADRYKRVEDILADFDKLKGLPDFLDTQTQALIGDKQQFALPRIGGGAAAGGAAQGQNEDETDVVSSTPAEEHRPYSLRERQARSSVPPRP